MRPSPRNLLIAIASIAAIGVVWSGWHWLRPIPQLNVRHYRSLMIAGRSGEAETFLRNHLRIAPDDPQANTLLATFILDRADPSDSEEQARRQADEALARLAKAAPRSNLEAAQLKVYQGKALYVLKRWAEVEARMNEALELDPTVPEAGWALLDMYYLQGRAKDASELALRLHQVEPDPRDRVQLLLELVRQDAQPPDAASIVELCRPALEADPSDIRASVVLGNALIRDSRADAGLQVLREALERDPENPLAWEGLLTGYDEAGRIEALADTLDQLPASIAEDPRFTRHRGRLAQEQGEWPAAVAAYRLALEHDPHDPTLLYRLARVLRFADESEEADRLLSRHESYKAAMREVEPLYNEANAISTFGERPFPSLYLRLADLRERLLWPEQADAWRRLADPESSNPS